MCFRLSEVLESSNKHSHVLNVTLKRDTERERERGRVLAERNLGKRGMWGI
jgi:hypothetical protein